MKRFQKLDDRGFRVSQFNTLQLDNVLQFFSTNLEKLENIRFYVFKCNSNKNQATKKSCTSTERKFYVDFGIFYSKTLKNG